MEVLVGIFINYACLYCCRWGIWSRKG